ncbi:MAG: GGDEF domain-containing protein [Gallionella sp.]
MLRRPESLVRNLARAALLGAALMPSLVFLFFEYSGKQQMAAGDARMQAQRAGYVIAANPGVWRYETERLVDQIQEVRHGGTQTRINELNGKIIVQIGAACQRICVSGMAPLKDYGNIVGELRVEADLLPTLRESLLIAGVGLMIGLWLMRLLNKHALIPLEQLRAAQHELAFYDTLTKLPNRRLFFDRLSQLMEASKRSGRYCALLFLDLDNFKSLNDTHGHDAGDLLLIEVANRIKSCVRGIDTVARYGGDEFVIVLSELGLDKLGSAAEARNVAEKICSVLSEPYLLTIKSERKADTTIEHHCTASIGAVMFVDHEDSTGDILKWGDISMYQAKEAGRNQVRFFEADA